MTLKTFPEAGSKVLNQRVQWYQTVGEAHEDIKVQWKSGWHVHAIAMCSGPAGGLDISVVFERR